MLRALSDKLRRWIWPPRLTLTSSLRARTDELMEYPHQTRNYPLGGADLSRQCKIRGARTEQDRIGCLSVWKAQGWANSAVTKARLP
jgi:hypothetical protein